MKYFTIDEAVNAIKCGEVVGVPTETVYGLAANALDENAVRKIFQAKGRPADNPLIVHICKKEDVYSLAKEVPDIACKLINNFWAGPLTIILPKKENIPFITSGGLETVGIRMPSHPLFLELIEKCGFPIAAPSANRSGYPSPTNAKHVENDMDGRISGVLDGGSSKIGLESTVVCFYNEKTVRILRPGAVTKKDFLQVLGDGYSVEIDENVLAKPLNTEKVISPGVKYKHYSPKAEVVLVEGDFGKFKKFAEENSAENTWFLIFDKDKNYFDFPNLTYGDTPEKQAHFVFEKLREFDFLGAEKVYVRMPKNDGLGLAIRNRLLRAAEFNLVVL